MEVKGLSTMKLNRETIKYIAVITMILNHVALILLQPRTLLSDILTNVGYFTAVTMCYFLVEGYQYTRSKKKYAIRLAVFAVISQIPFSIAFRKSSYETLQQLQPDVPLWIMFFLGFNMMFTLLLCFGILVAKENVKNPILRYTIIIMLTLISIWSDWALMAPIYTLLFSWSYGSNRKTRIAYLIAALSYPFVTMFLWNDGWRIIDVTGGSVAIIISGLVITYLYDGKQSKKARTFSKWFFYLIYPIHIMSLCLIRDYII